MKPWKLVLGAGAACAACCAAPIISGMATLGVGSGLFAGGVGALSAYSESWVPLAAGGVALAAVAGLVVWRRRRETEPTAGGCGCSSTATAAASGATKGS
jgi:LPXTG-motif cell wall-anchored protein